MAALVAAIHVLPAATKTWMRGTSPRMTIKLWSESADAGAVAGRIGSAVASALAARVAAHA
jgi:hypothetical protein